MIYIFIANFKACANGERPFSLKDDPGLLKEDPWTICYRKKQREKIFVYL